MQIVPYQGIQDLSAIAEALIACCFQSSAREIISYQFR